MPGCCGQAAVQNVPGCPARSPGMCAGGVQQEPGLVANPHWHTLSSLRRRCSTMQTSPGTCLRLRGRLRHSGPMQV